MPHIHVTLLYAGILGLLLVILTFNMTKNWGRVTAKGQQTDADLRRAEALVASFTDYVPLALLLMALIEANGAAPAVLHALGLTLVAARLMHAYGSNHLKGAAILRFLGAQLTYLVLALSSFGCLYIFLLPHLTH